MSIIIDGSNHHEEKVKSLQKQIQQAWQTKKTVGLIYGKARSNTTRSKKYNENSFLIDVSNLDEILEIDPVNKKVRVEPRASMEKIVRLCLSYGLMPKVVPEFKGITLGGAIMGAAAESTSHQEGIFFDSVCSLELLTGDSSQVYATSTKNSELFYGISGSYGSLGMLASAEISLTEAKKSVHLTYHVFKNRNTALEKIFDLFGKCDFLDGIIFSKDHTVIIEGNMKDKDSKRFSTWFVQHVKNMSFEGKTEEDIPLYDYLFRYDLGAFWMGAFLFHPLFLYSYATEGLLKFPEAEEYFSEKELHRFQKINYPNSLLTKLSSGFMTSQRLWALMHAARKWVQNRFLIQDFCIPQKECSEFLNEIIKDPATFPIWLCPIKSTQTPQIFAPHKLEDNLLNFGLYGLPSYPASMSRILSKLEEKTLLHRGRKVLYSLSCYSKNTFWTIYDKPSYEKLRKQTSAYPVWNDIIEKVLSS